MKYLAQLSVITVGTFLVTFTLVYLQVNADKPLTVGQFVAELLK